MSSFRKVSEHFKDYEARAINSENIFSTDSIEQTDENRHSDFSPVCFHSWTKGSVVVLQLMAVWRIICNVHCCFLILNKKEHLYERNINRGHIVFLIACVSHLNFPLSYLSVTLLSMVSFCICITSTFSLTSIYLLQTSPPS